MLESMTNRPALRSSHRSAANSERRAPVTAARRNAAAAWGSMRPDDTSDAALLSTARTSSSFSVPRGWDFRFASRATATTFVGTHPHRTASVIAARNTKCRFRIPASPRPLRSRRACHWSTSTAVRRERESKEIRSDLTRRIRLSWLLSVEGDHDALVFSAHRSSIWDTVTCLPEAVVALTVNSAARRCASFFVPRTVRLSWTGRPFWFRPTKARTSQTPGCRSRIVATSPNGRVVGMKKG